MKEMIIRLYFLEPDGTLVDAAEDYDLSAFAGVLPAIGDKIVRPGVLMALDRRDPANREIWTVVERYFNPRDLEHYVALVVEPRRTASHEYALVAG